MKKIIYLLACVWCMMLSCTHDEPNNSDTGTSQKVVEWQDSTLSGDAVMGMKILFCVGDSISVVRKETTRATTDINGAVDFETGDLVAVAVTQGTSAEEIKLYRVKSDGSLEYAGGDNDPFVWKSTGTVRIRAWSYGTSTNLSYTLDAPETFDYSLTANQQTGGYNELLYSKEAAINYSTQGSSPISLTFRHQLSRLVVNIEHDRTTTLTGTASMGENTNNTFPITARFDTISGGSWTATAYGTITPKSETAQTGYEATYSAVVFPGTYAQHTKMFTLANTDGDYVYAITESAGQTFSAGNQYNYTILVKDDLCRRNPLWWVAQYNMASNRTSLLSAHSTSSQYVFTWNTAMLADVSGYHVPTLYEHASIVPSDTDTGDYGTPIFTLTNLLTDPYEYSEIACNIGGKTVAGSTSVFGKKGTADFYAVRFINTPHASAWHYKWVTSPCNGLLIESYLLNNVTTLDEAKTVLAGLASSDIFTGTANTTAANQTPESTVVTSNCYVQRFYPACGYLYNKNGTTTSSDRAGTAGYYWTSTTNGTKAYHMDFYNGSALRQVLQTKPYGFSVRPFKDDYRCSGKSLASSAVGDIICSHGKAYAATTGILACGGQKVAMVAYKGSQNDAAGTDAYSSEFNHGLAVALTDVANTSGAEGTGNITWSNAAIAAAAYTRPRPSNVSEWFLPSAYQWERVLIGCGSTASFTISPYDVMPFSYGNIRTMLTACGGTDVQTREYWTITPLGWADNNAWNYSFKDVVLQYNGTSNGFGVRAFLAF